MAMCGFFCNMEYLVRAECLCFWGVPLFSFFFFFWEGGGGLWPSPRIPCLHLFLFYNNFFRETNPSLIYFIEVPKIFTRFLIIILCGIFSCFALSFERCQRPTITSALWLSIVSSQKLIFYGTAVRNHMMLWLFFNTGLKSIHSTNQH